MKRIIFILITLGLLIGESLAQVYPVQVTSQFIPPYSLRLSEYATAPIQKMYVNILLTDLTESNRRVRIKMMISGNGTSIQSADYLGERTPIYLDGGINLRLSNLDLQEYFALENLQGITPEQYRNPLPDGLYSFCFEIYDYFSGTRISSQTGCANVYLRINDPPFLNLPRQGDLVTSQSLQNIVFQWTPRHLDATNVTYEFTMRQLWDNEVDPQVAFFATPDFYTTTTMATTLLYGPAAPPLLAGKTYAWRVRAIVNQGISSTSIFRNEGYSEVFHFEHTQACDPPKFPLAQARGKTSQQIQWQENPKHLAYRVEYRKLAYEKVSDEKQETRNRKNAKRAAKGKQPKAPPQQQQVDYEWFTLNTRTTTATIQNLEANTTYQYRVGGQCTADRGYNYGSSQTFTTASSDSEVHEDEYSCGVKPEIAAFTNLAPLPKLNVNELFTAGDFPVTVKEVSGDNGTFTGEGFIVVPYLSFVKIKVTFDNVHINTDYRLTDGVVITSYDGDGSSIVDAGEIINALGELVDAIYDTFEEALEGLGITEGDYEEIDIAFDIEEITVNESGETVIVGTNGEEKNLGAGNNTVLTDENGNRVVVNEDGETGAVGNNDDTTLLDITTPFYAHQDKIYGFDNTKEGEVWQSLEATREDKVIYNIKPDSIYSNIYFHSPSRVLSVTPNQAKSADQELTLASLGIEGVSSIIASMDSIKGKQINKLNVQAYPKKSLSLRIIILHEENDDVQRVDAGPTKLDPDEVCVSAGSNGFRDTMPCADCDDEIGGDNNIIAGPDGICGTIANNQDVKTQTIDLNQLRTVLNKQVYNQAVFEWDIVEQRELTVNYDLNRNKVFEIFDYSQNAKLVSGEEFRSLDAVLNDPEDESLQKYKNYFIIISDHSEPVIINNQIVDPYGYHLDDIRYTFAFGNTSPNIYLTIAHELGHAAFGFHDNTHESRQPLNLMNHVMKKDYDKRSWLIKEQWDKIQDTKKEK